jgi:hypothetical protein
MFLPANFSQKIAKKELRTIFRPGENRPTIDMSEIALDARFAALARGKDEQFLSMLKNHLIVKSSNTPLALAGGF